MIARLRHLIRQRGPREIVSLVALNARHALRGLSSAQRRQRRADEQFDRRWGTDTAGTRSVGSLGVESEDSHRLHGYQAAQQDIVDEILAAIPDGPEGFTFIDYGSGKGRVLLMAALHPFRSVIGIEIAEEMHRIAEANIAHFATVAPVACKDISSLCRDARAFDPPETPLIAYFYNPCHGEILRPMVETIERSHAARPRPIWAVYIEPLYPEAFEASGRWHVQAADDSYRLYRL